MLGAAGATPTPTATTTTAPPPAARRRAPPPPPPPPPSATDIDDDENVLSRVAASLDANGGARPPRTTTAAVAAALRLKQQQPTPATTTTTAARPPVYGPPPPPSPLPPPARLFRDRLPRGRLEVQLRRAVGLAAPAASATRHVDAVVRLALTAHAGTTWDGACHVPGKLTAPPSAPPSGLQPLHDIVWPGGGDDNPSSVITLHVTHALPLAAAHHQHDAAHPPPPLLAYTVEVAAGSRAGRHGRPPLGWGACSAAGLLAQLVAAAAARSGATSGWTDVCLPLAPGAPPTTTTTIASPTTLLGHPLPPPAAASGCYLAARARFTPLAPGLLTVALHGAAWCVDRDAGGSGRGLGLSGTQDPYVRLASGAPGGPSATSAVLDEGGTAVDFGGQTLRLWMGPPTWGAPLAVTALDRDALKRDDLIGSVAFDPVAEGWLTPAPDGGGGGSSGTLVTLPMYAPDVPGRPCGHLTLRHAFLPAGELTVRVCEARRLGAAGGGDDGGGGGGGGDGHHAALSWAAPSSSGAVVELATDSAVAPPAAQARASLPARPGGSASFPVWTATTPPLSVDVLDATALAVTVSRRGAPVGAGTLPLAPLYRDGVADGWLPLTHAGAWGGSAAAGDVRLEVDFVGPPGAAFPACRPGEPGHDDRARLSRYDGDPRLAAVTAGSPVAAAAAHRRQQQQKQKQKQQQQPPSPAAAADAATPSPGVMSQRDIEAAFDGLDLDGNLYVGAAELRHVLACMGEPVTDEEINAMLALCDADGDGQVSLDEFAALMRADDGGGGDGSDGHGIQLPRAPPLAPLHRAASVGTAVKAAALAPPPPIITLRAAAANPSSAASSTLVVGSNPAARRAAMAARGEMEARAAKRDACRAFVDGARLGLPDLARWAAAVSGGAARDGLAQPASPTRLAAAIHAAAGAGRVGVDARALAALLAPFTAAAAEEEGGADGGGAGRHCGAHGGAPMPPPLPPPSSSTTTTSTTAVTVRSLLLSLSACVGATREARTLFAFSLLDPEGGGALGRPQLAELLAAQHLLGPSGGWAARKTGTLLALAPQAAGGGTGSGGGSGGDTIDLPTFRALAAQFGGLLLPEQ